MKCILHYFSKWRFLISHFLTEEASDIVHTGFIFVTNEPFSVGVLAWDTVVLGVKLQLLGRAKNFHIFLCAARLAFWIDQRSEPHRHDRQIVEFGNQLGTLIFHPLERSELPLIYFFGLVSFGIVFKLMQQILNVRVLSNIIIIFFV